MSTTETDLGFEEVAEKDPTTDNSLLSEDNIPDQNQSQNCFSCGEIMAGLYCQACGQKNDNYRRSSWSLLTETFTSIFSLENRMWRTWLMLFLKPGKVSRDFADGKRTTWTSPVKIYLALSIMLFGYMSLTQTRIFSVGTQIVPRAGFVGDVKNLDDDAVKLAPNFGFFQRQAELDILNEGTDFERVGRLLQGPPHQAFSYDKDLLRFGPLPSNELLKSSGSWPEDETQNNDTENAEQLREEALGNYNDKVDSLVELYNILLLSAENPTTIGDRIAEAEKADMPFDLIPDLILENKETTTSYTDDTLVSMDEVIKDELAELNLNRSQIHALPITIEKDFTVMAERANIFGEYNSEVDIRKLLIQILENPALMNDGISRYLPRIMFLLMPFAALIGLIFIRGKQTALLVDHLIHATYIHAVTFAFLLTLILLSQWTPLTGLLSVFFIGIAIYLPISTKLMFKRGWFKTIFASYSIATLYGFTMLVVLSTLVLQSVLNVAAIS